MDIQIFQYKESNLEEIRIILNEYLSFIAKELIRPPWNFSLDVEYAVNFTMNNLDKFSDFVSSGAAHIVISLAFVINIIFFLSVLGSFEPGIWLYYFSINYFQFWSLYCFVRLMIYR